MCATAPLSCLPALLEVAAEPSGSMTFGALEEYCPVSYQHEGMRRGLSTLVCRPCTGATE